MKTLNLIIEIIYQFANVLFPMAVIFLVGGFIWDLTSRRAGNNNNKKLTF